MESERDWDVVRRDGGWDAREVGTVILRFTLLFGLCVVALALVAVPALQRKAQNWALDGSGGIDPIRVGSTVGSEVYTIRRSVLQTSPNSICIIRPNGTRSGDC